MRFTEIFGLWHPPALCFTISFVGLSQLFAVLDHCQPKWYRNLSVVSFDEKYRLSFSTWKQITVNNFLNLLMTYVVGIALFVVLPSRETWNGLSEFPLWMQALACYIWGETWFWTSHWWVHQHPHRMRVVHAKHHEFRHLFAIVGLYCSPLEMLIVNWPLSIVFPILTRVHTTVFCLWMTVLGLHIANNHSIH